MPESRNILQRIALAWRLLWAGGHSRKASPFAWPAWRAGQPQWQLVDYQGYAEEGFSQNSIIYSAIAYKARAVTAAPLRAYAGDPRHPDPLPPRHELACLLARPNSYQSGAELMQLADTYLNLAGDSYIHMDRPLRGGFPLAMRTFRPDRTWIIPDDDGGLKGYLYVPEGKSQRDGLPILPQDMMHVKLPNPLDPLEGQGYGLSPISALARSADVDNHVTRYLKVFFERGAINNVVLKFEEDLDEAEIARIRARWAEIYGGVDNWAEVGVLDRKGNIERLALTFDEMGFGEIDSRNESRILGPFGVPPILLGTRFGLERSTYSNYAEARTAFWEDTFIPELSLFESEFDYYLAPDDDSFVRFDTSQVPALRADVFKQIDGASKLFSMGVPANTALSIVGLEVDPIEGGDTGYLPLSLVPVGQPRALPAPGGSSPPDGQNKPPPDEEDEKPEQDTEGAPAADEEGRKARPFGYARKAGLSEAGRYQLAEALRATPQSWEGKLVDAAAEAFEADRRGVLALLDEAQVKALRRKATVNWDNLVADVTDYLWTAGADSWRELLAPLLRGVVEAQGEQLGTALGLEWDVENLFARTWWADYQLQFAQPILQTTLGDLGELFSQAQRDGLSIGATQKRIEALFRAYLGQELTDAEREWFESRLPQARTELIARDQSMRAANAGSYQLYSEWGIAEHEWMATLDERTRPSHLAAHGQRRRLDEAFDVGGSALMFPGDGSQGAPLEEIIECRCVTVPVVGEG